MLKRQHAESESRALEIRLLKYCMQMADVQAEPLFIECACIDELATEQAILTIRSELAKAEREPLAGHIYDQEVDTAIGDG